MEKLSAEWRIICRSNSYVKIEVQSADWKCISYEKKKRSKKYVQIDFQSADKKKYSIFSL